MQRGGAAELPVSQWHEYKKVPGVLLAVIPIDDRVSLYARWGDWLPWTCWIVIGAAFVFGDRATEQEAASGNMRRTSLRSVLSLLALRTPFWQRSWPHRLRGWRSMWLCLTSQSSRAAGPGGSFSFRSPRCELFTRRPASRSRTSR